ncbi:hypothetical protein SLE2022_385390 [Rubroshorea leprosula]
MPSHEQSLPFLSSHVLIDGALSLALAYAAVCAFQQSRFLSSTLRQIQNIPTFRVADLRIVIDIEKSDEPLLVLRNTVVAESAVDGESWKSLIPHSLFSQLSRAKSFIIPKPQTSIWKRLSGWTSYLPWNKQSTSPTTIPFILFEGDQWPQSGCIIANLDVSRHPIPLTTVYDQLQPANASPYTLLQALCDQKHHVGLLDEEKILPLGMEMGPLGISSFNNGVLEIKTYMQLPYLLTDVTKDQMMSNLAFRTKMLFWSGIFLGSFSFGILGFAVVRKWSKWKVQREQRRYQEPGHVATEPRRYQEPGHVAAEPRRYQEPGHVATEPRRYQRPGHVGTEARRHQQRRHVAIEPRSVVSNDATAQIMEGGEMSDGWFATSQIAVEEETGGSLFELPRNAASNDASPLTVGKEPIDNAPDKTLCLICWTKERDFLFIPCRHLACCQQCAMSIEHEVPRRCPYCRQPIQLSFSVYIP